MKKTNKIVLALAAALVGTSLIAPSANAAVSTALTVNGSAATGGTTALAPVALPVPADNSIDAADALKISLTGLDTGTAVSASATNATIVTALATSSVPVTASSGTSTLSISTGTGTTARSEEHTSELQSH